MMINGDNYGRITIIALNFDKKASVFIVSALLFFSCHDGHENGSNGNPLGFRSSIALETKKWPDAVNHPDFTPVILKPGEQYTHTCIYRFVVSEE